MCSVVTRGGIIVRPSVTSTVIVPTLVAPVVVVRSVLWVGDVVLVWTRASVARATVEVRLRAGPALEVRVAAHGREVRWPRSEVVRGQVDREMVVAVVVARGEGAVGGRAVGAAEPLGHVTLVTRGRLPVNGLHTVLERARGPELPFADDSPDQGCQADGATNSSDDDDGVALELGYAARRGGGSLGRGRCWGTGDGASDLRGGVALEGGCGGGSG